MDIELEARAKINLALDVLGERDDGYHEVDMIMQEIELHDTITIEQGRGGFVLVCDDPTLRLDETNLVYKAWELMRAHCDGDDSVIVEIEKRIPIAAGLAGGSTDAAATIVGLNRLWNLMLEDETLMDIAKQIGSDVPFFIKGGTVRATGRGEIISLIEGVEPHWVVLINPGQTISTRYVYDHILPNGEIDIEALTELLVVNSPKAYHLMRNHLETVSFEVLPILRSIIDEVRHTGAMVAMMSGSGPTVFGIYDTEEEARAACQHLSGRYPYVELTRTMG